MTRDAEAIGAGLSPAREPRPIPAGQRIHVVGVAGAGASAAALLAAAAGAVPSGCDPGGPSPYTPPLEAAGIALAWKHDPAHVGGDRPPARLAVSKALTAVEPHHPELEAARRRNIPLEPWQQLVADAAAQKTLVGVAGTHGKSTSAGWLVHLLVAAGADPSASVGALMPSSVTGGLPATARWGRGPAFVVEADEYAGNFDPFRPSIAILTSVEWDHPDVFADRAAVVAAFEGWIRRMRPAAAGATAAGSIATEETAAGDAGLPLLIANVADVGVAEVVARLTDWDGQIVATALVDQAPQRLGGYGRAIAEQFTTRHGRATVVLGRLTASDAATTSIEIHGLDPLAGPVVARLRTAGRHNAANALGVAAAALALGTSPASIVDGLSSFVGVGRRLERKGESNGVVVYDDYGHHPTAIRETIGAVRQREPGRRIWAVYEPLTYHRTAALLDDFADALATADAVAVADIWAGRDPDTTVASAQGLATAVSARRPDLPIGAPGSVEATADWLAGQVRSGDAVLVMGGGRSYRIGERLLEALEAR